MSAETTREVNRAQQIAFLRRLDFFRDFSPREIDRFLDVGRWRKVAAGTPVIHEGKAERIFYILVKGEVVVVTSQGGRETELTRLQRGACFGEMAWITETRRSAGVRAVTDCYLLAVRPEVVDNSAPDLQVRFYRRLCEILAQRLIHANQRLAELEAGPEAGKKEEAPVPTRRPRPAPEPPPPTPPPTPPPPPSPAVETAALPPMPREEDRHGKLRLRRLVATDRPLPVYPPMADRLDRLLHATGLDLRALGNAIGQEPILALKVLQVANSPYYRRGNEILSTAHAILTLGMELVREILVEMLAATESTGFSGLGEVHRRLWRHSVIVGRIAEVLRETVQVQVPVDLHLAGLLHDLGVYALDPLSPTFYAQILRPDSPMATDLVAAEARYIGVDHATAGAWFGEKLGVPEPYLQVMAHHHAPQQAREHQLAVALVHLADLFASRRGESFGGAGDEGPLESFAWVMLQDGHPPFLEVNVVEFVAAFEARLETEWPRLTDLGI